MLFSPKNLCPNLITSDCVIYLCWKLRADINTTPSLLPPTPYLKSFISLMSAITSDMG